MSAAGDSRRPINDFVRLRSCWAEVRLRAHECKKRLKAANALVKKVEREAKATLLVSLRTEIRVVQTLLFLAVRENGDKRFQHLKKARIAFQEIHKLTARVRPAKRDLIEIEELRREIIALSTTSPPLPSDT